ncbi:MAG: aminotransferase class V-fold PLP-dependent enzyme [Actinomycetota bacterium]
MTNAAGNDLPGRLRHRFPVFDRLTYLNSCSQGALADTVRSAYDDYLRSLEEHGSHWDHWVGRLERVRTLLAALLNVTPSEVAVTASASAGVSALASAFDFERGRSTVVTTDAEFPTIGQIWHAQRRRGARVVHVPTAADHTLPLAGFERAIDDDTAIVSVTHISYTTGARTDLGPLIDLAHSRGAYVLVDAYQSVGSVPIDAAALDADFVVGGTLKYLLGTPGVGFLVARSGRTDDLVPTSTGWFAASDIFAMRVHGYEPATEARRFEAGTPAVPSLYAAEAGLELMLDCGVAETAGHVNGLVAQLRAGIGELEGTVVTPDGDGRHGALVAVAATDEQAYVDALHREGVVVSSRAGNVRVSPHCYNTSADIDAALAAFAKHRHLLRR